MSDTPTTEPEVQPTPQDGLAGIDQLTVRQVLDIVGDDPALAEEALNAELARADKARPTLLKPLAKLLLEHEPAPHVFVDGGTRALAGLAPGESVRAVIDRTTNRVVDPGEYTVEDGGLLVKVGGGDWAAGSQRWAVVRQD